MTASVHELNLSLLAESVDLECKAAQGRDGQGEVPHDLWKTYSAMANTQGGTILLGVQEKPRGHFKVIGLRDLERVRKAIWDNLHNRKQISVNLLSDSDIDPLEIEGRKILRMRIPRATRQLQPVHVGTNPYGGTYIRRHEGDYPADDETVRRMTAERLEESRDDRLLKGYSLDDLSMDSIESYRQRFNTLKPGHVWGKLPLMPFLQCIGAFGINRDEGQTQLRLAGLLMFGRAEVIVDELPYYMLDYQEQTEGDSRVRWTDRVTPDGQWSGNVYDFFERVYPKLVSDIKVPFRLQGAYRVDDSPIHEALREALANTLIHADYSGRSSVLIIKRSSHFIFRNPGRMRIPPEEAMQGGNSDCRNRRLQTMFQLIGLGDHAGSGLNKIIQNWTAEGWRHPLWTESSDRDYTRLDLKSIKLFDERQVDLLTTALGSTFVALPQLGRAAMLMAKEDGAFTVGHLVQSTRARTDELLRIVNALVGDRLLAPVDQGSGRTFRLSADLAARLYQSHKLDDLPDTGVVSEQPSGFGKARAKQPQYRTTDTDSPPYYAPDQTSEAGPIPPDFDLQTFGVNANPSDLTAQTSEVDLISSDIDLQTFGVNLKNLQSRQTEISDLEQAIEVAEKSRPSQNAHTDEAPASYVDWNEVPPDLQVRLEAIVAPLASRRKLPAEELRQTILALCHGHYLGLRVLALLLNRHPDDLRRRTLTRMVHEGLLTPAYKAANAPGQAYTSTPSLSATRT